MNNMIKSNKEKEFKIGIALSAGGAKGIAHLGVLEALEEAGIRADVIAGTSMGAVVGGLYALGKTPKEMRSILKSFDEHVIKNITKIKLSLKGIFDADRVHDILYKLYDNKGFSDTQIPFYSLAYNIDDMKPVEFSSGLLLDAVQASASIPGFFPPYVINNSRFVDGGIYSPIPLGILKDKCDFLIGVSIPFNYERIQLRINPPLLQVMARSISTLANQLYKAKIEIYKPDFMIDLHELFSFTTFEFQKMNEIINIGKQSASDRMKSLLKKIEEKKRQFGINH